jgi:adenylate cyclase
MKAFNIQAGVALENAKLFENVLVEKQYQKDILQSLSDAVISTDLRGRIVTINEAALELLGCPIGDDTRTLQHYWETRLHQRYVWEVIPIEKLRAYLDESLNDGFRQYQPEQALRLVLVLSSEGEPALAVPDGQRPDQFYLWGEAGLEQASCARSQVQLLRAQCQPHR